MVRVGGTSTGTLRMTVAKAGVCAQTAPIPSFAVALRSMVMLKKLTRETIELHNEWSLMTFCTCSLIEAPTVDSKTSEFPFKI